MKISYRWVIVAVGALMTCVDIAAMFSLAICPALGAAAIALAFPRLPRDRLQPA
jgi:hypothetical protein